MRIGLILPTNLYFAPYVRIYTSILDDIKIEYDLIYWDRELVGELEGIVYKKKSSKKNIKFFKLFDYFFFSRFVINVLKRNQYDKIIIFGPQVGLFILRYLNKHYINKFLFDYRDLSIEQYFPKRFKKLLNISALNCISSPGFERCLPNGYKYILSHNFDINLVKNSISQNGSNLNNSHNKDSITISTIGGIRDYEQNKEIIFHLKNDDNFCIKFIGKGIAENELKKYCVKNNISNVDFTGYYAKSEEYNFYKNTDFINIYYPKILSHETALSNRFYNALIYKKPMIATRGGIQADYIEKFKLGLSLNDCKTLKNQINDYIKNINTSLFENNCNHLLLKFEKDYDVFKNEFINFLMK